MKSFLIYDEKGDFAMSPHVTQLRRTISPLSLSTGAAKNACRNNKSRSKKETRSDRHSSQRGVDNEPRNYVLTPTYGGKHSDGVCLGLCFVNMRPPFALHCPLQLSLWLLKGGGGREREAVGGEMTGQAFDEFSEINMLGGIWWWN